MNRKDIDDAKIVKCKKCGMKYTNPILEPEIEKLLYTQGYQLPLTKNPDDLIWGDQLICLTELLAHNNNQGKVLDVGCGEGGFVYLCQQKGINAAGIELRENAVENAANLGIKNITNEDIRDLDSNCFDFVTVQHVIEHLNDTREFVKNINRILTLNGIALIVVPNYFSFQWRLKEKKYWANPYEHMNGFTVKDLDKLFNEFNFKRIPLKANYLNSPLNRKSKVSMILTKFLGNIFGLYPTKLLCLYLKNDNCD